MNTAAVTFPVMVCGFFLEEEIKSQADDGI